MISFLEKINKYATLVTGILTVVLTFYFFYINKQLEIVGREQDIANKKVENLMNTLKVELEKKQYVNDIRFKIYSEVKEALEKKDDVKAQKAIKSIIDIMLVEDLDFRNKMYDIISVNPNVDSSVTKTIVKTLITEKLLNQEIEKNKEISIVEAKVQQKTKPEVQSPQTTAESNKVIKVDVFYLEDILLESEPRAQKIVDLLNSLPNKYQAKKRILPRSINAKDGYKITENQIRFEPDEKRMAYEILKLITKENIFQLEQPTMNLIYYRTPNYISVFVRNM